MEECDESGDHRTRALQMVQFDAVKPRWSRAHSGDHHIFDLPTQPRARLAHGGMEDKVERRDVDEAASLQLDATRLTSVHGLKWRLQSKTGQELFVAQEGEFVALEAPHTCILGQDATVGCQTARMDPWSGLHAFQATSGHPKDSPEPSL